MTVGQSVGVCEWLSQAGRVEVSPVCCATYTRTHEGVQQHGRGQPRMVPYLCLTFHPGLCVCICIDKSCERSL